MSSADSSAGAAVLAKMSRLELPAAATLLYVASSEAQHADEPTTANMGNATPRVFVSG